MPQGPGKYDKQTRDILVETGAAAVVLIVIGGKHGDGFSVNSTIPEITVKLPKLLRMTADGIEKELRKVILTVDEQAFLATVTMESENGRSLILLFDGVIELRQCAALGMLPVAQQDDGTWRELMTGSTVNVVDA